MPVTYTGTNKKIAENILSKGGTVVNPDTQNKTGMFSSATATKTPTTTTTPQTGADKWGANAEKAVVTNNAPVSGLANLTGTAKTTTPTTGSMYSDASTIAEQSKGLTYKYMSEESPGEGIKSPYQSQQDAFMAMMEEQAKTVNALSDQYKSAFSKLQTELGDSFNQFQEQLKKMNANQQGRQVDIADPQFQEEMKQAIANGQTDFTSILEKYQKSGNTPEQIQELQQLGEQAVGMGLDPQRAMEAIQSASERGVPSNAIKDYFNKQIAQGVKEQPADTQQAVATTDKDIALESPTPDDSLNPITEDPKPTKEKVENAMATLSGMDMASLGGALNGAGANMVDMTSPEGIATLLLQQGLDYADDDSIRNYLLNSAENAKNSYMYALESYKYAIEEIDSAIMGEDFVPTTSEGLSAKVYAQSKEMGLESIEAEKQYQKEQYTAWRSQEADKRGRLEGYLKAKLVAMGAEDSSAGLSMMALQVNAADLRLQQADSEYNYGLSRLNMQSREIMMNFANNITQLSMQADANKNNALSAYTDRISEIEKDLIADDREKNKLRLDILGQYQDQMYKIDQDKKAQEWKEKEMAYKQIRDTVEDSYKLSGLMGTYYGVDANGNVFDSGIPTFDAKKWEQSNYLDQMKFQHTVENDALNQAIKMIDMGADSASVEEMLGMPAGSLQALGTAQEKKEAAENWFSTMTYSNGTSSAGFEGYIGISPLDGAYKDGTKVGQCGYFVRTKFFNLGAMGDTLSSKIKTMDNVLKNPNEKNKSPQVGDMVIFDVGTKAGHVALCTGVNEDGTIRVLESNWNGDEKVGHRNNVKTNNIVALHRGDLKPEYDKMLKGWQQSQTYSQRADIGTNALLNKTVDVLGTFLMGDAENNPYMSKYVKQDAEDFQNNLDPVVTTMFEDYAAGNKDLYNTMSATDKQVFQMSYLSWKKSNSVNPTGYTYEQLSPEYKIKVDKIVNDIYQSEGEREMGRKNVVDLINKGYVEDADIYQAVYGTELSPATQDWVKSTRGEIQSNPQYKTFMDMRTKFETVVSSLEMENGLSDIAAINSFQKMVDPGAVVREGDVALIQSAIAPLDKYFSEYPIEKLRKGAKLPQNVRDRMMEVAKEVYDINRGALEEDVLPTYLADAKMRGIDSNLLIPEYRDSEEILANRKGYTTKDPLYQEITQLTDGGVDEGQQYMQDAIRRQIDPFGLFY